MSSFGIALSLLSDYSVLRVWYQDIMSRQRLEDRRVAEYSLSKFSGNISLAQLKQNAEVKSSLPSQSPPFQGGVHRELIDTLTGARSSKLKSLGYMLEQCRKLRVKADYDIGSEFPAGDARTALAQCVRILNQADSILSAPSGNP